MIKNNLTGTIMTFYECLSECVRNKKLVAAYDELRGSNLASFAKRG